MFHNAGCTTFHNELWQGNVHGMEVVCHARKRIIEIVNKLWVTAVMGGDVNPIIEELIQLSHELY